MDPVIEYLRRREKFDDPALITTYTVYIHSREVEVRLHDLGSDKGSLRYMAEARYADVGDGPELQMNTYGLSLGNPDSTIEGALSNVHWHIFRPES